jgi:hypothetical protein
MRERVVGILISWHPTRGFGFVHCDHGADIWIGRKDLARSGVVEDDLRIGSRLSFVPLADDRPDYAPRATYIRVEAIA